VSSGAAPATTFFLVRHAPHIWQGRRLVGRAPHVPLRDDRRLWLDALRARFARERIDAVHASPLERAQETAWPIARAAGLDVETVAALDEVDFGAWTNADVDALDGDADWARWCSDRDAARAPDGESLHDVQARVVAHARAVHARAPGSRVVLVSHGDPLRTLVVHVLRLPMGAIDRIELEPGSVSTVAFADTGGTLVSLNEGARA
jgi:probable phosphoglycerate mutase